MHRLIYLKESLPKFCSKRMSSSRIKIFFCSCNSICKSLNKARKSSPSKVNPHSLENNNSQTNVTEEIIIESFEMDTYSELDLISDMQNSSMNII